MKNGFAVHWNGTLTNIAPDDPHVDCIRYWEGVERFHTLPEPDGRGWSDIAYSFGVCSHGTTFTGRGWNKDQFANGSDDKHSGNGPDSEWYSVLVFIGGNKDRTIIERPTLQMIAGVTSLIATGRAAGKCGMAIAPHSDWKFKDCPGPEFHQYCRTYSGRALPVNNPYPLPIPEDDTDMKIIDCKGKPALLVTGHRFQRIDKEQRDAFRSANVPAAAVTTAEYDVIVSTFLRLAT